MLETKSSSQNKAMVAISSQELDLQEIAIPEPGSGQILVEISYAAQNPTDVQSFDSDAFGSGAVYGCDFVGRVVKLGQGVKEFVVGDTVAALIWGGEIKGLGAYSRFTLAEEKITFKVPQTLSAASASTLPLAVTTAWLALFSLDCLNIDRESKHTVLIWGGSSSVGQYAIQIAALHSCNVITTCSPKNFELARKLGATHVFDYNDPNVTKRIRESASDGVKYVFDTIGNKISSAQACESADADCTMCTVRPGKANTGEVGKSVKVTDVLVWTAFLKDHYYGEFHWPPHPEDHQLSTQLYDSLPQWLNEGKIRANDVLLLNGLKAVPEGFQLYRDGKYSAQKVVYKL